MNPSKDKCASTVNLDDMILYKKKPQLVYKTYTFGGDLSGYMILNDIKTTEKEVVFIRITESEYKKGKIVYKKKLLKVPKIKK